MENKNNTALLVMDVQSQIIGMIPGSAELLKSISVAIKAARTKSIPVIYVGLSFRPGFPEVSPNNMSFSANTKSPLFAGMTDAPVFPQEIAPKDSDIIVIKKRVSAFTGSDLEVVLRSLQVQHLVLAGIATGGVVLSTLREAADKDYTLSVLSDGCADRDVEVHNMLLTKIFPRQATVLTIDEWVGK